MITLDSQLLADISGLSATKKLLLIEWILSTLDQPDPKIDKLWSVEAENRLDAYEKAQIKAVDLETILQKYK